ncbi:protein CASPARIAN STRIP INTEGRITY FACTOR 1-like [Mercurialis annua]|uniref:protein CASPARIAN STRIP INTEGRITY FACTOR 1-like n=1 Tax=Mercurialis annua TaxID=3986 RepID=UPI00215EC439|nr:protein CASPARIAN STRIP INTEGRITY FACTOR 1-like [Mercurialis annua]
MGLNLINKFSLLFLLISASFISTSFAGRRSKFAEKLAIQVDDAYEENSSKPSHNEEAEIVRERVLRANTKDYGNYDPAPALVRPPFKLIPN